MNLTDLQKRAAEFITERDPFGDHFSAHDLAQLDPSGGYVVPADESEAHRGLNECQFAKDVGMPEYSCGGECQYEMAGKDPCKIKQIAE
jgi:hypothetical protein